jgi:hypothetical protein
MKPGNRLQEISSASLCSLAGRYDNPILPRFLAPIDCLKIPALGGRYDSPIPTRFLIPIDCLKIPSLVTVFCTKVIPSVPSFVRPRHQPHGGHFRGQRRRKDRPCSEVRGRMTMSFLEVLSSVSGNFIHFLGFGSTVVAINLTKC